MVTTGPMQNDLVALRQRLETLFSEGELRTLCFDLHIDYESLPGTSKADKARELVAYTQRRGNTAALWKAVQEIRPEGDPVPRLAKARCRIPVAAVSIAAVLGVVVGVIAYRAVFCKERLPVNVVRHYDFEQEIDESLSLGVCDATYPEWWDHCHDSPEKLRRVRGAFTGSCSLQCQVELLPEREQVYSIRLRLVPWVTVDALSAAVHVPDASKLSYINLVALSADDWQWKKSWLYLDREGWVRVFLDLQQLHTLNGRTASESATTELHFDLYIPRASEQSETVSVRIDDVRLYHPFSESVE